MAALSAALFAVLSADLSAVAARAESAAEAEAAAEPEAVAEAEASAKAAPGAVASARAARPPPSAPGHEAATETTDGSLFTASRSAPRACSFAIDTKTVSAVRTPGSMVAAPHALRRKMAEQMRSSTEAVT